MEHHDPYLGIGLPNNLYWTSQGTVDTKKTAEVLIKDENLDIPKRYVLACIYCLENDILKLWNRMPEISKKAFYSEEYTSEEWDLVVLWTYIINGETAKIDEMIEKNLGYLCSLNHYAFRYAVIQGHNTATQYFLQKLTSEEKEESLERSLRYVVLTCSDFHKERTGLPRDYNADVLFYLISQINEKQQTELFKHNTVAVLRCLLNWPWQSFFIKTVKSLWSFICKYSSDHILREMAEKVIDGHKDYDYQKLFGEYWNLIPNAHKRFLIHECATGDSLLSKLLDVEDKENISLILKEATLAEKEKIVLNLKGNIIYNCKHNIIAVLAYRSKWDLLKFFIGECITSQEEMREFKKFVELITRVYSDETIEEEKHMWNKFLQMLDDLIYKDIGKRGLEEGDSSPAKRFHRLEYEEKNFIKNVMYNLKNA